MATALTLTPLVGTAEGNGQAINNNATFNGSEVDLLGATTTSLQPVNIYLSFTQTSNPLPGASIYVLINFRRVTGVAYHSVTGPAWNVSMNYPGSSVYLFLGTIPYCGRFVQCDVTVSGAGAQLTNVFVCAEFSKTT